MMRFVDALQDFLRHAGIPAGTKLTRTEWGVLRSALGKPRRLSLNFLREVCRPAFALHLEYCPLLIIISTCFSHSRAWAVYPPSADHVCIDMDCCACHAIMHAGI